MDENIKTLVWKVDTFTDKHPETLGNWLVIQVVFELTPEERNIIGLKNNLDRNIYSAYWKTTSKKSLKVAIPNYVLLDHIMSYINSSDEGRTNSIAPNGRRVCGEYGLTSCDVDLYDIVQEEEMEDEIKLLKTKNDELRKTIKVKEFNKEQCLGFIEYVDSSPYRGFIGNRYKTQINGEPLIDSVELSDLARICIICSEGLKRLWCGRGSYYKVNQMTVEEIEADINAMTEWQDSWVEKLCNLYKVDINNPVIELLREKMITYPKEHIGEND